MNKLLPTVGSFVQETVYYYKCILDVYIFLKNVDFFYKKRFGILGRETEKVF
jgi:hypothetical protein